jgi:hypothetical protein
MEETKQILAKRAEERRQLRQQDKPVDGSVMGPVPDSMTVFAQNPQQMRQAQEAMVAWAGGKVNECMTAVVELEENLETAKRCKWRTSALKSALRRARNELTFYRKTKLALEAGYVMVPNFPVGIFAIRTTRKAPKQGQLVRRQFNGQLADNESNRPPAGEGCYVEPSPPHVPVRALNANGEMTDYFKPGTWWEDVTFPFTTVKPEIARATSDAMALKVFDEIGCLPNHRRGTTAGDPILVGQIAHKAGYNEKRFSFLIAWFMDLSRM